MRLRSELMQLEMGMSTSRYFPASGTAGLARSRVSGNNRVPCPPPMMIDNTLLVLVDMRTPFTIKEILSCGTAPRLYNLSPPPRASGFPSNKTTHHVRHRRLRRQKTSHPDHRRRPAPTRIPGI